MAKYEDRKLLKCSFCSKSHDQVKRLIAGCNGGVYICNECIELCVSVLQDENVTTQKGLYSPDKAINLTKPGILKKFLMTM